MKKGTFVCTAAALASVFLSSCCACRKGSPKIANLEADKWRLTEFRGEAVPTEKSVVLTFDAEKKMVYGKAPCNNFFGGYSLFEDPQHNIEITNVGVTRMLCPNTRIEDGFVRELSDVKRLKIEGDRLLLLDAQGDLVALLTAVPATAEK